jgi:hypothetical protein
VASLCHGADGDRDVLAGCIVRGISYVAGLTRAIPASSPPAVTAPQSRPPGQAAVATPPSRPPSRAALSLAVLVAWLITVGLGVSMMARWITRTRRPGTLPRRSRGPVLNFTHLGLALAGLLGMTRRRPVIRLSRSSRRTSPPPASPPSGVCPDG